MRKRLAQGRREEMLEGVMDIIAARGFSDLRVARLASELHCSVSSLYKIAPSKDSLILLAIKYWADNTLDDLDVQASKAKDPADRARTYFQAGAKSMHSISPVFRRDVGRFESTRLAWQTSVSDPFIDRFVGLLDAAVAAGEVRRVNTVFVAQLLRQVALVTRQQDLAATSGLTTEQALMEIDAFVWDGIRKR